MGAAAFPSAPAHPRRGSAARVRRGRIVLSKTDYFVVSMLSGYNQERCPAPPPAAPAPRACNVCPGSRCRLCAPQKRE